MKDKLKRSLGGGWAEVHYVYFSAFQGAPGRVQKHTRTPPDSEIRENLKINVFFKENIGF